MDTLFIAPTFLCAATMVAAIDADLVPHSGRVVLLVTNNALTPEVTRGLDEQAGFASIAKRFDAVARLNDLIRPYHPRGFHPEPDELTRLAKDIREKLGLGEEVTIVAQSVHTRPTITLLDAFPDSVVHAVSDGLMSYGPTRVELSKQRADRLESLLYLDLVPGLQPLLLGEFGVERRVVPSSVFRPVVRAYGQAAGYVSKASEADGLLLGQYLAALGILTAAEEEGLHLDMVRTAHALGLKRPAFKPHPSAPPVITTRMEALAEELGMTLAVLVDPMPVEVLLEFAPPGLVIGCFSTGLATAAGLFGLEVVTIGTGFVARKLPNFQDSNRVPLALSHICHRRALLSPDGKASFIGKSPVDAQHLVEQLGRAMQPRKQTKEGAQDQPSVLEVDPSLEDLFAVPDGQPAPKARSLAMGAIRSVTKSHPVAKVARAVKRSLRRGKVIYGHLTFHSR